MYNEVTRQAQVLAFADDFWLLFVLFCGTLLLLPLLSRVRTPRSGEPGARARRRRPRADPRGVALAGRWLGDYSKGWL